MSDNEFDHEQRYQQALEKAKVNNGKAKSQINDLAPDVDSPPPGWKKAVLPFLQREFIPKGWRKVGDTYATDEE